MICLLTCNEKYCPTLSVSFLIQLTYNKRKNNQIIKKKTTGMLQCKRPIMCMMKFVLVFTPSPSNILQPCIKVFFNDAYLLFWVVCLRVPWAW